jgi:GT2 family glycosyltransferase
MAISIVIPVRNDSARLARCLESIKANQNPSIVEIIVADNGSTDGSAEVAARLGARVIPCPGLRVSAVRNMAARTARGELIGYVDSDHELSPTWTTAAIRAMADPAVGAAGALCDPPPRGTWVQRAYGVMRGKTTHQADVGWLGAGNMVVRRQAFQAVKGFDEALEACEDVDLCKRLKWAGWRIVGDEGLRSIHHGDPVSLRALFRAERWRGRNNLKVSLRGGLSVRELPSLIFPVVTVLGLVLAIAGAGLSIVSASAPTLRWSGAGVVMSLVPSVVRTVRSWTGAMDERSLSSLMQLFIVALTYDLARSTALVLPGGYHRR